MTLFGEAKPRIESCSKKTQLKRTLSEDEYLRFIIKKMCESPRMPEDDEDYLNEMIDAYRLLRNRLADPELSPEALRSLADNAPLLAANVEVILADSAGHKGDSLVALMRIALQFLANATARRETAEAFREAVHRDLCGVNFMIDLLEHLDDKIRHCGSMLIYNCLRDPVIRDEILGCREVIQPIFEMACCGSNEWCVFAAELFLAEEESFIRYGWPSVGENCRLQIVKFARDAFLEQHANGTPSTPVINEKNACGLASVFVEESDRLAAMPWAVDESQLQLQADVLELLCHITAVENQYQSIRDDQRVLDAALSMLKWSAQDKVCPKDEIDKLAQGDVAGDASTNFRTHLVRLLANLCYKHPENQKLIRERQGIALILNSTPLDANNAFITEWSVFALRNLLDGCPENQRIIKELQPQAFVADEAEQKLGDKAGIKVNDSSETGKSSEVHGVN